MTCPFPTAGLVGRQVDPPLLTLTGPGTVLWALKPAEEGMTSGVIARVWNLSGSAQRISLSLATGIARARRTTHLETDIEPLPLSGGVLPMSAGPFQMLTFRLSAERRPPVRALPAKGGGANIDALHGMSRAHHAAPVVTVAQPARVP